MTSPNQPSANSRWDLDGVVHWPMSMLAVYVWLILAAVLIVVPLAVAYKAGQSRSKSGGGR